MIKIISKIGNSQGIIFDAAVMELAHLRVGDKVNMEVHEGGTIMLTPVDPVITPEQAGAKAKTIIKKNAELFRRLS